MTSKPQGPGGHIARVVVPGIPSLVGATEWLNGAALDLADLRGKVVLDNAAEACTERQTSSDMWFNIIYIMRSLGCGYRPTGGSHNTYLQQYLRLWLSACNGHLQRGVYQGLLHTVVHRPTDYDTQPALVAWLHDGQRCIFAMGSSFVPLAKNESLVTIETGSLKHL